MDVSPEPVTPDSSKNPVLLFPDPEKCLDRVPALSKVDGVEPGELEVLNKWVASQWKNVLSSDFAMNEPLTRDFTDYLEANSTIALDLDKADSYLSVQRLLYKGLRFEALNESESVSQCKLFHSYYYSCRENPTALNNLVVLANVIWSLNKFKTDEFALTCLVDILLQSYMVALDSFVALGGVTAIRETLEYLAQHGRIRDSAGYLMKCMELLERLDVSYRVLQTSKIGVPVNCIALSKSHAKLNMDYECGNDKVKLKATNLIKKWKAIRDAALPQKPGEPEHKLKRPAAAPDRRPERQHSGEPQANDHEGSFVLNIINTIAEEKEKEKKRKMELRNSHMGTKYKPKAPEPREDKPAEKPAEKAAEKPKPKEKPEGKEPSPEAGEPKPEEKASDTNKLASLMNFFKEYSSKAEASPQEASPATPTAAAKSGGATPRADSHSRNFGADYRPPPAAPFSYPMYGQVLPPGVVPPPGLLGHPGPAVVPPYMPMPVGTPPHPVGYAPPEAYNFDHRTHAGAPGAEQAKYYRPGPDNAKDEGSHGPADPPWK